MLYCFLFIKNRCTALLYPPSPAPATGARMPTRSLCLVILSLSKAGPGRSGRQQSFTDIYHTVPWLLLRGHNHMRPVFGASLPYHTASRLARACDAQLMAGCICSSKRSSRDVIQSTSTLLIRIRVSTTRAIQFLGWQGWLGACYTDTAPLHPRANLPLSLVSFMLG